ncbi:MAG: hypothetical protein ACXWX7_06825 [Candidatus Binatia bacterium]
MKKKLESQLAAFIGLGLFGLAWTLQDSHEFNLAIESFDPSTPRPRLGRLVIMRKNLIDYMNDPGII